MIITISSLKIFWFCLIMSYVSTFMMGFSVGEGNRENYAVSMLMTIVFAVTALIFHLK